MRYTCRGIYVKSIRRPVSGHGEATHLVHRWYLVKVPLEMLTTPTKVLMNSCVKWRIGWCTFVFSDLHVTGTLKTTQVGRFGFRVVCWFGFVRGCLCSAAFVLCPKLNEGGGVGRVMHCFVFRGRSFQCGFSFYALTGKSRCAGAGQGMSMRQSESTNTNQTKTKP